VCHINNLAPSPQSADMEQQSIWWTIMSCTDITIYNVLQTVGVVHARAVQHNDSDLQHALQIYAHTCCAYF
jgi:hypothetical protein